VQITKESRPSSAALARVAGRGAANRDKKYLGGAQGHQGDEHEAVEQQHELQGEE
jgi:hypothetical protein